MTFNYCTYAQFSQRLQLMTIVKVIMSAGIQHTESKPHAALFISRFGASLIASWLNRASNVTKGDSDDQSVGSLDDTFLLQSSPE